MDTTFNFSFMGFEWLQFLHGNMMYGYYILMGAMGLFVATGLFYRISSFLLALMWTLAYLSEKSNYNNHYYLMVLLVWIMFLAPAHRRLSLDVRTGRVAAAGTCRNWYIVLFRFQIAVIYLFAAIAKMNPDWLQAMPMRLWAPNKSSLPLIGGLFHYSWMPWVISYFGLCFDALVIPAFLFRRTRTIAFILSVFFHLSNSLLFSIGTFPYLAIALCIFFFPTDVVERRFRVRPAVATASLPTGIAFNRALGILLLVYCALQLWLPVRHHFIPGNVAWTEEGHRMAWRMMLRSKQGYVVFRVKDKKTGTEWDEYPEKRLSEDQAHDLASHPDFCWQYARHLKKIYHGQGKDVAIYADGRASLNGHISKPLYDVKTDLGNVRWKWFGHNQWIMPE